MNGELNTTTNEEDNENVFRILLCVQLLRECKYQGDSRRNKIDSILCFILTEGTGSTRYMCTFYSK